MRPNGLHDLEVSSFMKKFKDKKFAAKCDRELIKGGCAMLGMDVKDVAAICIEGMRPYAHELGLDCLLYTSYSEPLRSSSISQA